MYAHNLGICTKGDGLKIQKKRLNCEIIAIKILIKIGSLKCKIGPSKGLLS